MSQTPTLGLPFLLPNQAQKHVTVNTSLSRLDALVQLTVQSGQEHSAPEAPSDGCAHILPSDLTGDGWPVGGANDVAIFTEGAWQAVSPVEGWTAFDLSTHTHLFFDGAGWAAAASSGSSALLGVNTTADATNRLAVKSDAELLSHDDVTPGTGDARKIINKASAAHTASLIFQSEFEAHSELGLCGQNNLSIKVSPDGAAWLDALVIDSQTGVVTCPLTSTRDVLPAPRTYYVRTDGADGNTGQGDTSGEAFAKVQHALDTVFGTLDLNGFDVTIAIAPGVYSEGILIENAQVGAGRVRLVGDSVTPSNVVLSSGGGTSLRVTGAGARVYVSGIKVENSGFAGWHADAGGMIISDGRNEIGQVGGHQIVAEGPSMVRMTHDMIISGGCAGGYLNASNTGYIYTQGASWTIVNSPSVGAFFQAHTNGVIYTFANSFQGSLSGQRYSATLNGVIQTNSGGNPNYLPGDAPGNTSTGGQYQ